MNGNVKPDSLVTRLREGFDRIGLVLRADQWASAGEAGLNPAQAQVLGLLTARPAGLRPTEIAAQLAISAASIADTVGALVRKGLARRNADPADARAAIIDATPAGRRLGKRLSRSTSQVERALAALTPAAQQELLRTQIALIRQLQQAGAIPVQRMCVSCRYFRANAHPHASAPHHCEFVNAAIGGQHLQLDCAEHDTADPAIQASTWTAFASVTAAPTPVSRGASR